jgi:SAM-dependent methyltransferase
MTHTAHNDQLRQEFNRWAEAGRGEGMEEDHLPITLPVIDRMHLAPEDSVLDVGCGAGWTLRLLAERVTEGRVVGMDVCDEMVRHARKNCAEYPQVMAAAGSVDEIPWESAFFTKVISIESAYYWPDPATGLREIFRVLRPGGGAWILINYYKDNTDCHQWGPLLPVPTKLLSGDEWAGLFGGAGFESVKHERVVDPTPAPGEYKGRWFRDAAQLAAFRRQGALLVYGVKPQQ